MKWKVNRAVRPGKDNRSILDRLFTPLSLESHPVGEGLQELSVIGAAGRNIEYWRCRPVLLQHNYTASGCHLALAGKSPTVECAAV
ncbi:hypothetical protein BaRGS_00019039 [Batillaria attramentaria]|uniref:Uncharacterized protein n=1 Tax=Batillaria attramentaria TaxID=370345 RepID=A0ABD0KR41_9CAEN